jgi:putative oxidoreductase
MKLNQQERRPAAIRSVRRLVARGQHAIGGLRTLSLPLLRISLGLVFVWFGLLKITNTTPVAALVAGVVPWFDPSWFVPLLGVVEVLLGAALIAGRWLTATATVLVLHLSGTFLVLVTEPEVAFQHDNPFLLTAYGEFVIKNLVLIAAGLVLAAHGPTGSTRARRGLPETAPADDAEVPPRLSPDGRRSDLTVGG